MGRICTIEGCGKPFLARGWCTSHYMRWRRWGSPTTTVRMLGAPDEERFWSYVEKTDDCWFWTGGVSHGYGTFFTRREDGSERQAMAHRYAYELANGPIPRGVTLDHSCHTAVADECREGSDCPHRRCVRPDHMDPMSLSDNIRAGGHGARLSCKRGHDFTPENTGLTNGGRSRYCRTCKRADQARLRERRRAARAA